ncbi:cobalamin biosynthesis protein [Mycolicibacillus parakoreensis]|uniref:Cobalamin biosynthesis protein CobD n=1 Tax=Mycolicibacillus parakoreensis TaxID=1069221 RepID=A0ABY3U962_9MYCO|nr:cobalamin biosynthesis protein [Mycolicibacillus parakoreensis]MCV7317412.1 cobalamin biosynthesis protein [Mycolicibacillus parakoreensis]ULN53965.1 cobalamin biosynthesis protein [Mycolicibacillus parakoreensis]HLR99599.1 cobalamin biosynthesis protein [Mycolicibacillus parakoreensis]
MFAPRPGPRATGVLLGYLVDLAVGDPRRRHPVGGFGRIAGRLEQRGYRDGRAAGVVHVGVLIGALVGAAAVTERSAGRLGPGGTVAATAAATWAALGGATLGNVGLVMAALLDAGDLRAARVLLPSLCGRDPDPLDADGLTRATVESIAENTSDAQVAPLLWAAVGGVPGVLGYRAINTLDAMIGHRSPRYTRFGWAAARLDDLVNYLPARASALLAAVCAPLVGGSAAATVAAWRRDAGRHPSPNAGVVEAAFAGALGVRLGGPTAYRHELEIRPSLGAGPDPTIADLRRAVRLSRAVQAGAALLAVPTAAAVASGQRRRP